MGVEQLLALFAHRWRIAVIVLVMVISAAAAYTLSRTPVYSASADVFVTIVPGTASESLYQDSQFLLGKVKSYTELADKPIVLETVSSSLGLDIPISTLAGSIVATNDDGTSIITIEASSTDPQTAAELANGIARELGPTISRVESPGDGATNVDIALIRKAGVPTTPTSPRVALNLILGLLAGVLLGGAAAVVRERLDRAVRSPGELAEVTGYPTLGSIPVDPTSATQPLAALDQTSLITESYRTLRARLRFMEIDNPPRSILITSTMPGEGKTTVAVNLALILAQSSKSVCIVDADLRRPNLANMFGLDGSVGLSDVLVGDYSLEQALLIWGNGFITVLLAGTTPPDPGYLLASLQMQSLVDELAKSFDYVIYDTPPLGPVADAAVLATRVDGSLVVVRHGKGDRKKLTEAIVSLEESNSTILGSILNAAPTTRLQKRYGQYI